MILALGIDSIEIKRFESWPMRRLQRIFTAEEIEYALSVPAKSAERFAARFAAKEAFYKAISTLTPTKLPLFTVCAKVWVTKTAQGTPELAIDWDYFKKQAPERTPTTIISHISLSHTHTCATAVVILEQQN